MAAAAVETGLHKAEPALKAKIVNSYYDAIKAPLGRHIADCHIHSLRSGAAGVLERLDLLMHCSR